MTLSFLFSSVLVEKLEFTDDTAMARSIAQSLIDNKGKFDGKDLAKK